MAPSLADTIDTLSSLWYTVTTSRKNVKKVGENV